MSQKPKSEKPRYYTLNDNNDVIPIPNDDVLIWARGFESQNRVVKTSYLPTGNTKVSTVFLGLDHGFNPDPNVPPVVFETMTFSDDPDLDEYQERYYTYNEAVEGHERIVKYINEGIEIKPGRKLLKLNLKRCEDSFSETYTAKFNTLTKCLKSLGSTLNKTS